MTEKQTKLLDILLDTLLAVDLAEGVLPELIVGSDEYGQYLFPQSEYAWEKAGSVEVLVDVHDDKRQFTGNVLHNAAGELSSRKKVRMNSLIKKPPKSSKSSLKMINPKKPPYCTS